jgi:glycine/D-amino acid oxidase-like deaminating enzyme
VTSSGARPARAADVVIVGGGVTGCSIAFHAFRLDRFAAMAHDDGGAFSHSYLR